MTGRHLARSPALLIVCVLGILVLGACAGQTFLSQEKTPTPTFLPMPDKVPEIVRVEISGFSFSPSIVTATKQAGAYVIWTNNDTITHAVRSDADIFVNGELVPENYPRVFDSGELAPGETYAHLFNKEGVYKYHCRIHPEMKGEFTVIHPKVQP